MANYKPKPCGWCGKVFTPNSPNHTYCQKQCKHEHDLDYNRQYLKDNPDKAKQYRSRRKSRAKPLSIKTCRQCGSEFAPPTHLNIYCSDKCARVGAQQKQRAARAKRRGETLKECPQCGSTFTPPSNRSTYCSPECVKQRKAEYTKQYLMQWRKDNPDCYKKYYYANLQKCRERHARWRESHKEHIAELRRRYSASNPDKVGEHRARRAQVELDGNATPELIQAKWEAGSHTCILCGQPIDDTLPPRHPASRTIEHLTPIVRGGRHDLDNIDFAHWRCNSQKRDKTLEEYRAWQARLQQAS